MSGRSVTSKVSRHICRPCSSRLMKILWRLSTRRLSGVRSMDDHIMLVFDIPRKALQISKDLGNKLNDVHGTFKNFPDVRIIQVTGSTAEYISDVLKPESEEESGSVTHARRELALIGNDEDFNRSIINAIKGFNSYGHSGGSAAVAVPMLY